MAVQIVDLGLYLFMVMVETIPIDLAVAHVDGGGSDVRFYIPLIEERETQSGGP